jgi:methionyl-tRNA formyltransferase
MKIVFLGSAYFSIPTLVKLIEAGHEIACVYSQPPRRAGRGKKVNLTPVHEMALKYGITVRTPENFKLQKDKLAFFDLNADLTVVVAYGLILPLEIIEAARYGSLNIHASILPKWRGAAPIHRAIMSGDSETGVCIMKMDAGLDTGPVVAKESTLIKADDTTSFLSERLADLGAKLLIETIKKIDELIPKPQSTIEVSYAKKIDKKEAKIDWSLDFQIIEQQIRGLSRYPGAWAYYNDERIKFLNVRINSSNQNNQAEPGMVIGTPLVIACEGGALEITLLQRSGKSVQTTEDFLRGFPIQIGSYFT